MLVLGPLSALIIVLKSDLWLKGGKLRSFALNEPKCTINTFSMYVDMYCTTRSSPASFLHANTTNLTMATHIRVQSFTKFLSTTSTNPENSSTKITMKDSASKRF